MYAQQSDAIHNLHDPIPVYVSMPEQSTGIVVYVEQLAFADLSRLAMETEVGEPDEEKEEGDAQDESAETKSPEPTQSPDGTPPSDGLHTTVFANASVLSGGPNREAILVQKMPTSDAEESHNEVYVVEMSAETFQQMTAEASIAPDMGSHSSPLDIDALSSQVFADIKERLALEQERLYPMS